MCKEIYLCVTKHVSLVFTDFIVDFIWFYLSQQFRYKEHLPWALKNVTVNINDQEKVGVVGRTGAGKSSLAVALYRLVNIESGSIKIAGVNIIDIGW